DAAPASMSINASTGTLRWTPNSSQLGGQAVIVRATDAQGGFATQSFTITVRAGNTPPNIASFPPTTAAVGRLYSSALRARAPDNDPLSFTLTTFPDGMTIDPATGSILWPPTDGEEGSQAVTVQVEDPYGGGAIQDITLVVAGAPDNQPPRITSTPGLVAGV